MILNFIKSYFHFRTHGINKSPEEIQKNHGDWYYEMQDLGYNYRLNEISCGLVNQLNKELMKNFLKESKLLEGTFEAFKNISEIQLINEKI